LVAIGGRKQAPLGSKQLTRVVFVHGYCKRTSALHPLPATSRTATGLFLDTLYFKTILPVTSRFFDCALSKSWLIFHMHLR
jgi:hypothetical protein